MVVVEITAVQVQLKQFHIRACVRSIVYEKEERGRGRDEVYCIDVL